MSEPKDTPVLVCIRVESGIKPVGESVVKHCDDCGAPVWASPASLEASQARRFRCQQCFDLTGVGPDDEIHPMADGQKAELAEDGLTPEQIARREGFVMGLRHASKDLPRKVWLQAAGIAAKHADLCKTGPARRSFERMADLCRKEADKSK